VNEVVEGDKRFLEGGVRCSISSAVGGVVRKLSGVPALAPFETGKSDAPKNLAFAAFADSSSPARPTVMHRLKLTMLE